MQRRENDGGPNGIPMAFSGYTPTMSNTYPYWLGPNPQYGQANGQMAPKGSKSANRAHGEVEGLSQAFGGLGVYPSGVGKIPTPGVSPIMPYSPMVNHAGQNIWADPRYYVAAANGYAGMQRQAQNGQYFQQGAGFNPNQTIWAQQQIASNEVPELSGRRNSLSSNEEPGPQTPFFGATQNSAVFHPKMMVPDNSPQTWGSPSPQQQLAQPAGPNGSPTQLWREAHGYVIADLDAKCQQEPTIPRPIPAIFSGDKSRGTLETSLENKTHTTNVYIRGLHPDTTDEMLEAYGARFGSIASAKSMIDQHTGLCKG